ncbi:alpha-tocopherol transfer protein-like isoform X2 [Bacillus rossius redtenbacheri]|uniref:alpha-tocopherol transfer protein-like isoform X2 n=1 Tax=Bacillus rossius redtenbacheri TaxID=93214 RepID=UPI002FDE343E
MDLLQNCSLLSRMAVRELPGDLAVAAAEELHEDKDRRDDSIAHIKQWLSKQPHLAARTDDQWILAFLRSCKYSLESTKEKIDSYYSLRTALPEMFKNRDPLSPELQEIFNLGVCFPLPYLDVHGRRIILMRPGKYQPTLDIMHRVNKLTYMMMEILLLEDDYLSIKGMVTLLDLSNVTLGHMTLMTPAMVKKMSTVFQDGYPIRLKGMNFFNTPPQFEVVFNLFKTFMKDKLRKRLFVHGSNRESLYEQLPRDVLPEEYGGTKGTTDGMTEMWRKKVESYREWFIADEQFGVDEKKRTGKPKNYEDVFGVEGSFRTLNVD